MTSAWPTILKELVKTKSAISATRQNEDDAECHGDSEWARDDCTGRSRGEATTDISRQSSHESRNLDQVGRHRELLNRSYGCA